MYFFWLFFMCSQPYLLLFGLFGFLGKEAEKAAEDICAGFGSILLIVIVCVAIYSGLHWLGLVH